MKICLQKVLNNIKLFLFQTAKKKIYKLILWSEVVHRLAHFIGSGIVLSVVLY
ncbi:MAG: hypothetical protein IIZ78_14915 [Clostridiales bacterium]|nr:hypothetical protein [Clostridiales bacterium]